MPQIDLPRATPESQGIASSAILAFLDTVESKNLGLHSLMVLCRGSVVAEGWWTPYRPGAPHMLYSLSKSFTSTAVGLAVAEGRLSLDDPVLRFFPDEAPAGADERLRALRVRHLLTMSTGHAGNALDLSQGGRDGNWARQVLSTPLEFEPGTHFAYNNGATYLAAAIVQKVTGESLVDYLAPRLFDPLGIERPAWEQSPQGVAAGAFGLSVRTEDIAKFGLLYLRRGAWGERQVLPPGWVAEATSKQIANGTNRRSDWNQGYGFQFWRCRKRCYRGDGAFGQFCVVMPEQDAVVAITAGTDDLGGILDAIWTKLLPAMGAAGAPSAPTDQARLAERLAALQIAGPSAFAPSGDDALGSRRLVFDPNEQGIESVVLRSGGDRLRVEARREHGREWGFAIGYDGWLDGRDARGCPVAARGAWTAPDTFTAMICRYETPFVRTLTCRLAGGGMSIDVQQNVGFGARSWPTLRARVVDA